MGTARLALPIDIYLTSDALKRSGPGVQAFRVSVQADCGIAEDHYVINAQYHRLDQNMRQAVVTYLLQSVGECVINFILDDLPGRAEVVSVPPGRGTFIPAASVAVVKAACGWDESNPMIIKINNSEEAIHLSQGDAAWVAISR
jgi:hypothetical protein